ncbi:MAG: DnaA- protein [Pseudomonadota bacterium]|nr:DnaA- protein [Pseudomonadota bacterium]
MQPQLLDLFTTKPSFDNFISLNNESLIDALKQQNHQFMHIVGATSSGKTHLLKSAVATSKQPAFFIDSQTINSTKLNTNNLPSLNTLADSYDYIAIDNIDQLNNQQQIALFDLFNNIKLNYLNKRLLTSSSINLEAAANLRDDLKTRILSGINLHLKALSDSDLHTALSIFTTQEGISLGNAEQSYLINHYTRNIGILIQTIKRLVETALLNKRNITIPLIKEFLLKSTPNMHIEANP